MKLYLAIPVLAFSLFFAACGVAALTRGWILPTARRHVRSPRRYGWGQLLTALALVWEAGFGFTSHDFAFRQFGVITGTLPLIAGLILVAASQRRPRNPGHTH